MCIHTYTYIVHTCTVGVKNKCLYVLLSMYSTESSTRIDILLVATYVHVPTYLYGLCGFYMHIALIRNYCPGFSTCISTVGNYSVTTE